MGIDSQFGPSSLKHRPSMSEFLLINVSSDSEVFDEIGAENFKTAIAHDSVSLEARVAFKG